MRIRVKVIPKAKKEKVVQFGEGLKVYVSEPATENRANKRLIEMLSRHYNTKKYNIEIVKGASQSNKVIQISESR